MRGTDVPLSKRPIRDRRALRDNRPPWVTEVTTKKQPCRIAPVDRTSVAATWCFSNLKSDICVSARQRTRARRPAATGLSMMAGASDQKAINATKKLAILTDANVGNCPSVRSRRTRIRTPFASAAPSATVRRNVVRRTRAPTLYLSARTRESTVGTGRIFPMGGGSPYGETRVQTPWPVSMRTPALTRRSTMRVAASGDT